MKPLSAYKSVFLHALLYGVGFAVMAAFLPAAVFVPLGLIVAVAHAGFVEHRKRQRYNAILESAKASQIDYYPLLQGASGRGIDEVMLGSLKEVATELEKKSYQLVEKNIQLLSLKEISLTIITSLNESRIVDSVESFLSKGLAFKEIFIGIYSGDARAFHMYMFREAFGEQSQDERTVALDELEGMVRKGIISRKPILIKDPEMHPLGDVNGRPMFEDSTMESYLIVPMVKSKLSQECWKSEACVLKHPSPMGFEASSLDEAVCASCNRLPVLGVIGVTDGFKAASLSQADLVAVETLALQISTLLENTQLYNELKKEEGFRDNVINSMMNGLITVDTHGRILLANQTTEDLTGYGTSDLAGMHIDELIVETGQAGHGPVTRALHAQQSVAQKEVWLVRKDGNKLPISLNTSFLMDDDKRIQGAIALFLDMTKIKRMEEKIQHLDKLAALGRFSSSMAHEIRNPLTGIVAGLQYLSRVGGIPADQDENITFILSEVDRIDRLISDILSVVRVGDLVYHPVQIESLVKSSITTVSELAKQKGVRIESTFPEQSRSVMADSDRITQVMINLLKNAVEASHFGGEIRVNVTFPVDPHDVLFDDVRNLVIIEVTDDGEGFADEDKGKIFEPFFTTKPEGTGLGLYVSYSIVERHGGYVFVESEKGKGTTFTVYLPVEKVEYGDSEVGHSLSR